MRQSVGAVAWESDENTPNFVGSVEKASEFLRELAGPVKAGETKRAIDRAGKLAGLSFTRASDLWYRKARRVEEFEQESIAAALVKNRRVVARKEFHELRTRMARLETLLAQSDPEFHQGTIEQVREQLRG